MIHQTLFRVLQREETTDALKRLVSGPIAPLAAMTSLKRDAHKQNSTLLTEIAVSEQEVKALQDGPSRLRAS